MNNKAAIYHFTDKSEKRPKIYQKQIEVLKEYASSLGYKDVDVYCDMSKKRCERTEFERLITNAGHYEALITKDFYHISKNTGKCITVMRQLRDIGLNIHSIENGTFDWGNVPVDESLRVATYARHFGSDNEMKEVVSVRNDIFKLFARKKTNWNIVEQYFDKSLYQRDDEQIEIMKLIDNKDKYDLILVHNFNDIHWRTANFCKMRDKLGLDIYSLQEGLLQY